MTRTAFLIVVLSCVLLLGGSARATSITSFRSGSWADPLTWGNSPAGPTPGAGDFVTISSGHTVVVASATTVTLFGISIQPGGTLSLVHALSCGIGDGGFSNAGRIEGNSPLRAEGANQFFLAQSGTFAAPLEVFQSSTIVNGAIDGAVTVMPGGRLKGTGPFNGPLTVAAGGILGGAGVMTVTNDVVLNGTLSSPAGCCPGLTFNFSGSTFANNGSVVAPIAFDFNFTGSSQSIAGTGAWQPTNIIITTGSTVTLGNELTINPFGFRIDPGGTLSLAHPLHCEVNSGGFANAGVINGTAPLRAQGSNQFVLTQTGTFVVPLEVSSSSTIVNGRVDGHVTVVSPGFLKGAGPFNGPITVASGGTLGGPGVMTVNNNVILNGTLTSTSGCCPGLTFNFSGATFTNNGVVAAPISFAFNFVGASQTLSGTGVFMAAARIHSGSTLTLGSNHQMNNITVDGGGTMDVTGRTLSLLDHEPLTNNGTIVTAGSTIVLNGPSYQHLGVTNNIVYHNLTCNNPEVLLSGDITVTGVLALNSFDLLSNGGVRTLTLTASASLTGTGDVVGRVKRTGPTIGIPFTFNNTNTTIRFDAGSTPSDVTVELTKQPPPSLPTAVARTYDISATGGSGYSATVRLRYRDADLNGNQETTLGLWRLDGSSWTSQGRTAFDATADWTEREGVTTFSSWALASATFPADMAIAFLSPNRGGDTGALSLLIHGRGIEHGASVRLVRAGQADIPGTEVAVAENGRSLSTTFDLRGKARGVWSVVVTNASATSASLPDAFTIDAGREPALWVDLSGRATIIRGRDVVYRLSVGNTGNIDATDIIAWVAAPAGVDIKTDIPYLVSVGGLEEAPAIRDGYAYAWIYIDRLRGDETKSIDLHLNSSLPGLIEVRAGILEGSALLQSLASPPNGSILHASPPRSTQQPSGPAGVTHAGLRRASLASSPESCEKGQLVFKLSDSKERAKTGHVGICVGDGNVIDLTKSEGTLSEGLYRTRTLKLWAPEEGTYLGAFWPPDITREIAERAADDASDVFSRWDTSGRLPVPYFVPPAFGFDDCVSFVSNRFSHAAYTPRWSKWSSPGSMYQSLSGKLWPETSAWKYLAGVTAIFDAAQWLAIQGAKKDSLLIPVVASFDPNDKAGPGGVGSLHYVPGDRAYQYIIYFENLASATAPAQEITVIDYLDRATLDPSTLSLGPIVFGTNEAHPPAGATSFAGEIDLRPGVDLIVRINAELDQRTGTITWQLRSIDPATGQLPSDPLVGALPPNIAPPHGEGRVVFTIAPRSELGTGTQIRNKATIVFDANAPIETPEWLITLDRSKPSSHILVPAPAQCTSVHVTWSGSDTGVGIVDYTIFVSENDGPFSVWLQNTTATSGTFVGQMNKTYAFFSVARDATGNIEDAPTVPDATILLRDVQPPSVTAPPALSMNTDTTASACGMTIVDSALGQATATDNCSDVTISRNGVPADGRFPVGVTTITYTATDSSGNNASATQTISVRDNTPPSISGASVTPSTLWPPKHQMMDATVGYDTLDNCDPSFAITCALGVTSNEPIDGTGDADTSPDWEIIDAHHVRLRGERAGSGNGRIYTITIRCTDMHGNSSAGTITASVPRNRN